MATDANTRKIFMFAGRGRRLTLQGLRDERLSKAGDLTMILIRVFLIFLRD